jgi:hypothetical protein
MSCGIWNKTFDAALGGYSKVPRWASKSDSTASTVVIHRCLAASIGVVLAPIHHVASIIGSNRRSYAPAAFQTHGVD